MIEPVHPFLQPGGCRLEFYPLVVDQFIFISESQNGGWPAFGPAEVVAEALYT
jgi:hypothetical protein